MMKRAPIKSPFHFHVPVAAAASGGKISTRKG